MPDFYHKFGAASPMAGGFLAIQPTHCGTVLAFGSVQLKGYTSRYFCFCGCPTEGARLVAPLFERVESGLREKWVSLLDIGFLYATFFVNHGVDNNNSFDPSRLSVCGINGWNLENQDSRLEEASSFRSASF